MDILDILLDILLKPPQPFIGLFFIVFFYMVLYFVVTFFHIAHMPNNWSEIIWF